MNFSARGFAASSMKRSRRLLMAMAVAGSLATGLVTVAPVAPPAHAYPAPTVDLVGHGFGHGRGMGQFGALGYALAGWPHTQILDHYYGGTAMGAIGDPLMSVRILRLDNLDTIVTSQGGASVNGGPPVPALLVQRIGPNTFRVSSGGGCGGPWSAPAVVTGPVTLSPAAPPSDDPATMLQICEAAGTRWYRGDFVVVDDGGSRTVNRLTMQAYLRGVVPRESPASWGALGDGKGMNALRAQAVAARSYAQVQHRYPYAKTCDSEVCQVYAGFAVQDAAGFRPLEVGPTNLAVDETAGQVRVFRANGAVASTEFSSSTGGHTAGGTFPPVVDDGDAVGLNPNHTWTARVPVSAIEAAFPGLGGLRAVNVTRRNGLGDFGGRVVEVVLVGAGGNAVLRGEEFRSRFRLKSDWFAVTNNTSGGTSGYWIVADDGGVFAFGEAGFFGSTGNRRLNSPVLNMAATPTGGGYWLVAGDGGIFSFGDAQFWGSTGNIRLNQPVVGMATTPSGNGYWLVARDGGIFSFGDARFFGSTGAIRLNQPVVGMARTPSGNGYWLVASDGGIFSFGDARFLGSTGAIRLNKPVVDMAATPSGNGYSLLGSDGGIFAFGDAAFRGSLPGQRVVATARGIESTATGNGYSIVTEAGRLFPFGDAPYFGDVLSGIPGYRGGVRGLSMKAAR